MNQTDDTPRQQNLSLDITPSDWAAVKELLREVEAESLRDNTFTQVGFWLSAVRLFSSAEERMLSSQATGSTPSYHRPLLEALMGLGGMLSLQLKRIEETHLKAVGLDPANFDAVVEELRLKHLARYGGMSPAHSAQILTEVFGGEAGIARTD